MPAAEDLTGAEIERRLDEPVAADKLSEAARGKQSACIVVDDLARPTPASVILPGVIQRLNRAGIPDSRISVVVATGTHGRLTPEQLRAKVGATVCHTHQVLVHDAQGSLEDTRIPYGDDTLKLNSTFVAAEFKVGISCILPHSFAGFSGGAKMMLPGLANTSATARSHKFVQMGLRGGQDLAKNRFRLEIEEIARQIGFEYTICVIPTARRGISDLYAGDIVEAHRAACLTAESKFATPVSGTYDALLLNAYPKDTDLIQLENAMIALKSATRPVLKEEGVFILATAATEGQGVHGLFAPEGVSYRPPQRKRALKNRELWLYVPGCSTEEVRQLYWEGYPVFHRKEDLYAALQARFPQPASMGVVPCASMQQLETSA